MPSPLTPQQILALARIRVGEKAPYFRSGILYLVPRETPELGTFATTKNWILLWDPAYAEKIGVDGVAAVLVHELWHLLRDHFGRFPLAYYDQDVANLSGDLAINPGVIQSGFQLPPGVVYPHDFGLPNDLTAEQYYEKLQKMVKSGSVRIVYVAGKETIGVSKNGKGQIKVRIRGCGSCSGRPIVDEPSDEDSEGRTAGEIARAKNSIAEAIRSAGRGSVPAGFVRWADDLLQPPKIRWQEKLSRVLRASVASNRPGGGMASYAYISRRQAGLGFGPGKPVIPAFRATTPRVTILVDTSGSMSKAQLLRAMSEAEGILRAVGASVDFVVCDAAVHAAKRVRTIAEACSLLRGGGGSNFVPAFSEIERRRPRSHLVVAATDGDITVPEDKPLGMDVIWLLVGSSRVPCSWGTSIEVDD